MLEVNTRLPWGPAEHTYMKNSLKCICFYKILYLRILRLVGIMSSINYFPSLLQVLCGSFIYYFGTGCVFSWSLS